jgi:tetratricopeptide (TPR) repeat protein/predicted Ser/Thr protein kinase
MGEKDNSIQCPKCFTYNSTDTLYCSKCGSPLGISRETISYPTPGKPPSDESIQFKPGDLFGRRYRIIEEIGRGGMGKVYKAEDTELNITVALKIILPKYASLPSFIEGFKRETLTARAISHENVIRIHDIGEADNIKYISMDYIKGQNLRELIRASGSLTVETTVNMACEMCEALKAAHRKGIVHYDLKPSNIMVDSSGRVYIMDFGLAKSIQALLLDKSRAVAGTPQYMSPEQARSEKTDHRSDIYSLGVIMFEMLTGRLPFEAFTANEYREKHIKEPPPLPSKINPLIPAALEAVVLRCLEKDREKRYQDVEEILETLKKISRKPYGRTLARWIQKPLNAAVVGILVLLVVMSVFLWKWRAAPPPAAPKAGRISMAIMFLTNNTGDKSLDYLSRTFTDLLITDLLQSRYIRVLTVDKLYEILRELKLHEATNYSSEDLKRVASLGSVDQVLRGDYTRAGNTYRINAFVFDAKSMRLLGSEKVTGAGTEAVFTMVDELTNKIKKIFKLSPEEISADIDKDIRMISTNNEEAFRYYTDAVKLADEVKFKESNKLLEKAVELDPEFALAYRELSENFGYMGNVDQANSYLQKALALLNRVSEREYYLIQGFATNSFEVAINNYKKLLNLYPDDVEANIVLGALYRNIEEWDLAQERAEKVLEIDSRSSTAYEILSEIYRAKGLYDKARTIIEEHQSVFSNLGFYHNQLAQTFLCQSQYELALAEVEKASNIEPGNFLNLELGGNICQVKGDFDSARKAYEALINMDDNLSRFLGLSWMGQLYLMQGEFKRCREELAKGIEFCQKFNIKEGIASLLIMSSNVELQQELFPEALESSNWAVEVALEIGYPEYKIHALHVRGLAYLKNKRLDDARRTAEQLKQLIERSGFRMGMRSYHHLMGMIAREEGRMSEAIDDFEVAFSLLPKENYKHDQHAFFLDSLASAFYQSGDMDRAQQEYEKIISLTTGRLRRGDIYSLSFYWLGKILQAKGQKEKAIEYYGKFLELWKNADKGLEEIVDAQMQLAALKKEAARK